jgi:quercetin dioxygenase-like cupin family protein
MSEREPRPFLVRAEEVMPFCLEGHDAVYESRALIEPEGAGSKDLLVNHFTLRAGQEMARHVHPDNDELYYMLEGVGFVDVGGGGGKFEEVRYPVSPGSAVFIPAGTYHRLVNDTERDVVLLTIWPHLPKPGSNPIYDGRIARWGSSFRYKESAEIT